MSKVYNLVDFFRLIPTDLSVFTDDLKVMVKGKNLDARSERILASGDLFYNLLNSKIKSLLGKKEKDYYDYSLEMIELYNFVRSIYNYYCDDEPVDFQFLVSP